MYRAFTQSIVENNCPNCIAEPDNKTIYLTVNNTMMADRELRTNLNCFKSFNCDWQEKMLPD